MTLPYPGDDARNEAAFHESRGRSLRTGPDGSNVLLTGLEPVANEAASVLVLGSMPGTASLNRGEYYAHPRNRFWRLMDDILLVPREAVYAQRVASLVGAGVALWDVLKHCTRVGSLDRRIAKQSEVPNELARFLEEQPLVRTILFNGRKAADAFRRHVEPELPAALRSRLDRHALPSTSPANARTSYAALLSTWRSRVEAALP